MELNFIDLILIGLFLLLIIKSAMSGFIQEITSLLSVTVAGYFAYSFSNIVQNNLQKLIYIPPIFSNILSHVIIFLVIVVSLRYILKALLPKEVLPGSLDMILGVFLGFAKGVVILCIMLYCINLLFDKKIKPEAIKTSVILTTLEQTIK